MSEIDPWALPQNGGAPGDAGIPGAPQQPQAFIPAAPLNKKLPIVVLVFGVLYVLVSLAEVFVLNREASLFSQSLANPGGVTQDTVNQAQSDDNTVKVVSDAAFVVFIGALISIGAWQRSLNTSLGFVGARRAVFRRAGYVYFRATWLISLLLSLFLSASSNSNDIASLQDAINHDHEYMLYYGLRALAGVVLIFFAVRLKKFSEEGFARVNFARVNRDSFNADAFKADGV